MHLQSYCKDTNACPGSFQYASGRLSSKSMHVQPSNSCSFCSPGTNILLDLIDRSYSFLLQLGQAAVPTLVHLLVDVLHQPDAGADLHIDTTVQELTQQRVVGNNPLIPKVVVSNLDSASIVRPAGQYRRL